MTKEDLRRELLLLVRALISLSGQVAMALDRSQKQRQNEAPEVPLQVVVSDLEGNTVAGRLMLSRDFMPMSGHGGFQFSHVRPLSGFVLELVQGNFGFCVIRGVRVGGQSFILSQGQGGAARFQYSGAVDPALEISADLVLEFPK